METKLLFVSALKVKSSMARSFPVENLLPQIVVNLSTTCSNAVEVAQWGAPRCSRPQPATDNGVRDGRSNWLAVSSYPTQGSILCAPRMAQCKFGLQIARLAEATVARTLVRGYARPTHCRCGYSGYKIGDVHDTISGTYLHLEGSVTKYNILLISCDILMFHI